MIAFAVAAVGILGTIGGVLLGKMHENKAWWREVRLARYAAFLQAINEISDACIKAASRESRAARLRDINKLTTAIPNATRWEQEIRLVGTDEVWLAAREAFTAHNAWAGEVSNVCERTPDGRSIQLPDLEHKVAATARFVTIAQEGINASPPRSGRGVHVRWPPWRQGTADCLL